MEFGEKVQELRSKIENELLPLINNDYVLWEVPHYTNIGDILIWQGEMCFLKKCRYSCLGMVSKDTCCFPKLSPDTIILFQGGGNFGDLWRDIQEFRLKVIETYPENRIIIFPQSVYYQDNKLMYEDARKMALHRNLILCARDNLSNNLLKENFDNQILLLPDMAFCIDQDFLNKWKLRERDKDLFLKRQDKESIGNIDIDSLHSDSIEVRDWPSIEKKSIVSCTFSIMKRIQAVLVRNGFKNQMFPFLIDWFAINIFRLCLLRQGIRFVSSYRRIYTTRLHVMILSVLLHKKVKYVDNSYKKNSSFYRTWLKDLADVSPLEK